MNIEAVILFCGYDEKFHKLCIDNLLTIGIKCNVVTCTHLWAGDPEDQDAVDRCNAMYKDNPMYKYARMEWFPGKKSWFWEAAGRYVGTNRLVGKDCEYILYIDIDEIIDPVKTLEWLRTEKYKRYKGMKLRGHIYFMSPHHRLRIKAYNAVMARADYARSLPFSVDARLQYFNNKNKISRWLAKLGLNPHFYIYKKEPFIHHYTGVRTREDTIKKVTNWGHKDDRNDWLDQIEQGLTVTGDRVAGYRYDMVENMFQL